MASTLLSARQDGQNIKSFMENSDWGYQAGVGLDIQRLTLDVPAKERADVLRAADSAARAVSPVIKQVTAGMLSREQQVTIANSEGLYTGDTRVYTRLSCSAVASDGVENQTGSENPGARCGFELFTDRVDAAKAGRDAAKTAATMLTAPYCAAGEMPVKCCTSSVMPSTPPSVMALWLWTL